MTVIHFCCALVLVLSLFIICLCIERFQFFKTCGSVNVHLDKRFARDCNVRYTNEEYIKKTLLLLDALQFMARDVKFVLMYGGLIGYYMNGELLPFDDDLDLIVVGDDEISRLIAYNGWETDDYLFEVNPWNKSRSIVQILFANLVSNVIDARMFCKHTGMFVELTFLYKVASDDTLRARDYNTYASSDILPIQEVPFYGRRIFVPNNIKNTLIKRYGKILTFKNYTLRNNEWYRTDYDSVVNLVET